jgi:hypothetical protein
MQRGKHSMTFLHMRWGIVFFMMIFMILLSIIASQESSFQYERTKWQLIFVIALCSITVLYRTYVQKTREREEITTFGKIYQIENASKGNVNLKFYFLIQGGDTIKSSHFLNTRNTGDYYLNKFFAVEYNVTNPDNNEILLDTAY